MRCQESESAHLIHRVFGMALCSSLAACCTTSALTALPKPTHVRSLDQAATVLIAPSMVAPWSYVSAALKPAFTMTGDTAVSEVVPTTEQIQSEVLNAFGASLAVGLPQSQSQSSQGQTQALMQGSNTAAGVTTTSGSSAGTTTTSTTTTTGPGVVPTIPSGTPAGAQLPTAPAISGGLSLDPVLKYKAATYLNQEVQLFNQEVDYAAGRECFVPYVVKLKLAVMNYRPFLAYSVHTRVSFLPHLLHNAPPAVEVLTEAMKAEAAPTSNRTEGQLAASHAAVDRAEAAAHVERSCVDPDAPFQSPIVIPFLAADDMEVALKSRATEAAQQIGLALNVMSHGVGANAGVNNVSSSLTAIASQDLSSVLTVARDNDNTLYVHIEPSNQASGEPNLVGQTYDIAVLLLVPRSYFPWDSHSRSAMPAEIGLATYTDFRDASSGALLPPRPEAALGPALDRIMTPFLQHDAQQMKRWRGLQTADKLSDLNALILDITRGDANGFSTDFQSMQADCVKRAARLCVNPVFGEALWVGLGSYISDSAYKTAVFEVPIPARLVVPQQAVLVADDKTHPMQAQLAGVSGATLEGISGYLRVKVSNDAAGGPTSGATLFTVPAQSLSLDTNAHVLSLTFPSLGKAGLTVPSKPPLAPALKGKKTISSGDSNSGTRLSEDGGEIVLRRVGCKPLRSLCVDIEEDNDLGAPIAAPVGSFIEEISLPVKLLTTPKPTPTSIATLATAGSVLTIDRGASTGSLPLAISLPKTGLPPGDLLSLTVTGAPVVSVIGPAGPIALSKYHYQITQQGLYTLNFSNLIPGSTISVSVQALKSDGMTPDQDAATGAFTAISIPASRQ